MRAGRGSTGRLAAAVAAAVVVGLLASVPVTGAGATPRAVVTFDTGPVGVIKDDVVRVNVTNLNATTEQAQVSVLDEKGATLGRRTLTLAAGQTDFFDVNLTAIVGRIMARTRTQCANNLFLVSTEIYDATSVQTKVNLNPSRIVMRRQFPAVGIVDGQTARLSMANLGTMAGVVTLDFMEQDGKVVKTATLSVPPKQTVFLDYEGDGTLGKQVLRATGGAGSGKFAVTLEVFDTSTGGTVLSIWDPCSGQQCLREQ